MSDFRALAHLQEQLGEERWQTLISSDNTGKVKELCSRLIMPNTMAISSRMYEIVPLLHLLEYPISGEVVFARALEMNARSGKKEAYHIIEHAREIPVAVGNAIFLFANWINPENVDEFGLICRGFTTWTLAYGRLSCKSYSNIYALRRVL